MTKIRSILTVTHSLAASALALSALAGCGAEAGFGDPEASLDADVTTLEAQLDAPDEEYVDTPMGRLHRTCVHEIASDEEAPPQKPCRYKPKFRGHFGERRGRGSEEFVPTVNGWVENSFVYAGGTSPWFTILNARWVVPSNPSSTSNQTIFYFPGLENTVGTLSIIQPVLQWGVAGSPAFGGNSWTIASWYVDATGVAMHSTPKTVSPGTIIDGQMSGTKCTASGSCTWRITTGARIGGVVNGISTTLTPTTSNKVYNYAVPAALEAYNITACNRYSATHSVTFGAGLTTGPQGSYGAWSGIVNPVTPSCNYNVTNILSGGLDAGTTLTAF